MSQDPRHEGEELAGWVRDHLVEPRRVEAIVHRTSFESEEFWLVTDYAGIDDSFFRVVYNPRSDRYGCDMSLAEIKRLRDSSPWTGPTEIPPDTYAYMGDYGSFLTAVEYVRHFRGSAQGSLEVTVALRRGDVLTLVARLPRPSAGRP